MEHSKKIEDGFEVSTWMGAGAVCYVRMADSDPYTFAKIRKSKDNARYIIYVGNKYVGFSRNFETALAKSKCKLREHIRKEGKHDTEKG